jgi:hypothetical protein
VILIGHTVGPKDEIAPEGCLKNTVFLAEYRSLRTPIAILKESRGYKPLCRKALCYALADIRYVGAQRNVSVSWLVDLIKADLDPWARNWAQIRMSELLIDHPSVVL